VSYQDADLGSLWDIGSLGFGAFNAVNSNASPVQQGIGAASLANSAANLLVGPTQAGGYLGPALGGAAVGYNVFQDATNPNLSTGQRAGHAGGDVANAALSYFVPYYGEALALNSVGTQLEKSKSPQLQKFGIFLDETTMPAGVKGFQSVLQGDESPAAAFKASGGLQGLAYDVTNLLAPGSGSLFKAFGIKLPFLNSAYEIIAGDWSSDVCSSDLIPQLKNTNLASYNIDPSLYNSLTPDAREAGLQLGQFLSHYAGDAKKNPNAYAIQAQNMILNRYGDQTPTIANQILRPPPGTQQPQNPTGQLVVQARNLLAGMGA